MYDYTQPKSLTLVPVPKFGTREIFQCPDLLVLQIPLAALLKRPSPCTFKKDWRENSATTHCNALLPYDPLGGKSPKGSFRFGLGVPAVFLLGCLEGADVEVATSLLVLSDVDLFAREDVLGTEAVVVMFAWCAIECLEVPTGVT